MRAPPILLAVAAAVSTATASHPPLIVGTPDRVRELVDDGRRDSPTFRALWAELESAGAVQVVARPVTEDRLSRARSTLRIWSPPGEDCVAYVSAEIGVPRGGLRGRRVALLAHEIAHVLHVLAGSRDERAGTEGERIALAVEAAVADEMDRAARGKPYRPGPEIAFAAPAGGTCPVGGAEELAALGAGRRTVFLH